MSSLISSPNTNTSNVVVNNSNKWCYASRKLRFFAKIRRLLFKNNLSKDLRETNIREEIDIVVMDNSNSNSNNSNSKEGDLHKSVKKLHFGSWEEKEAAAAEIRRLAKDVRRRRSMAELGVIPPLVAMFGSEVATRRTLAVQALLELANGSYTNKALMLEAGLLSKIPEKMDNLDHDTTAIQEIVHLMFSISSLANNSQSPLTINTSRMIPFLVDILESTTNNNEFETCRGLCLATLHNLSSVLENAGTLIESGLVNTLLRSISAKESNEKALAILGNLAVTLPGKKALEQSPLMPESLIEIMTWDENPKCQELSVYVLMILAHRSSKQRQRMAEAGIVPVLLEVALLGSALAQKRAMKLLQWFKDERQTRVGPHSGPQMRRTMTGPIPNVVDRDEVVGGTRLMKDIVKQSLYKNMETITRRANGQHESSSSSSRLKALVASSSSKSLPY